MKRQIYRSLLFTVIITMSSSVVAQKTKRLKQPNIIFYLADDQDKYDYGCYGNDKINTPAVNRLAKEGVMFDNAFTGQAICAPSRTQLYTGNYPLKNGVFLNHIQAKNTQVGVSRYLETLGYDVILAGKSHVKPKEVFDWTHEWRPVHKEGEVRPYAPIDEIETYFKSSEKPFCMFISSDLPHAPYYDVVGKTANDFEFYPFNETDKDKTDKVKEMAGYYRNVEEDNNQLERVLELVDKYLDKNTIFIYSADHGKSGKFTVYDRGLNVPFVVRWPGVIDPDTRSDIMIHYTDVLPTFIEISGGKIPENIDGKSFLPSLKGSNKAIHKYIYGVQSNQNILSASVFPSRMIRSKKYKYIRNFNSIEVVENNYVDNIYVNAFLKRGAEKFKETPYEELYDIENDPFEMINLAKKPKFRKIKEELIEELYIWMNDQEDFLVKDNYMPILKPVNNRLDISSKYISVPKKLENTLNDEDYLILHY